MIGPKLANDNTIVATQKKRNGTEWFMGDQDGVAKKWALDTLFPKNTALVTDLHAITVQGQYRYGASTTNAPTANEGIMFLSVKDATDRTAVAMVTENGHVDWYVSNKVGTSWSSWQRTTGLHDLDVSARADKSMIAYDDATHGHKYITPSQIPYDNEASSLEATTFKGAIDELDEKDTAQDIRIAALEGTTAQVFGLDFDNADDTYARTDMAIGLNFGTPDGVNPITSDFDNYYPWKGIKQVKMDSNKNILAYRGDDLYDSVDGEYIDIIPQFWFRDWIDGTVRHLRIANSPVAGYKPAFLDKDGKSVEYGIIGRVPAGYDTELRSKPDMGIEVNRSYSSFITAAYAKGDGTWWLYDASTIHKLALLMAVESGSFDVKTKFGAGIQSGMPYGSGTEYQCVSALTGSNSIIIADTLTNFYAGMVVQIGTSYTNNSIAKDRKITSVVNNGDGTQTITVDGAPFDTALGNSIVTWGQPVPSEQIDALGGGSGYILQFGSASRSHVCYRGIWDLWGNGWQFTYGFARYDGRYYVCFDQSKYNVSDPRSDDGWFDTGIGEYINDGYQYTRQPYVTDKGSQDFPIAVGNGAGSHTFYAAYLYSFDSGHAGIRILRSGGSWEYGARVSLFFCFGDYVPSSSNLYIGSRLIG